MNDFLIKVMIQFFTQEIYINIDNVCFCIEIYVPNIQSDIRTRYHLIPVLNQVFKKLEFFGGQRNSVASARYLLAVEVDHQVADP